MVLCGCACLLLWFCNETRKKHLVGFRYKKLANANRVHIWVFGYHCFCSDTNTQHLGVRVCLIKCHLSFKYLRKEFDKSFIFILSVKKKPNLNKRGPSITLIRAMIASRLFKTNAHADHKSNPTPRVPSPNSLHLWLLPET